MPLSPSVIGGPAMDFNNWGETHLAWSCRAKALPYVNIRHDIHVTRVADVVPYDTQAGDPWRHTCLK